MSQGSGPDLPKVDFSTFILSMTHSALVHMGDGTLPDGNKPTPDLMMARHSIDMIELIAEKTKGNLTGDEERLLQNVLYELRMRYVEVTKGNK